MPAPHRQSPPSPAGCAWSIHATRGRGTPVASSVVSLEEARAALARHDWRAAYASASADEDRSSDALIDGAWLEVRADAAWWLGRMDDCIASREAAYAIYDAEGVNRRAAQCAVWLYEHHVFRAQPSIAGAWLRRARQRIGDDIECVEYGNLLVREVEVLHGRGELDAAVAGTRAALELARRLRSADLEAEAQQAMGRVLIDQGSARTGLEHLDEAMLSAIEGRLGPYSTGKVYCSLISSVRAARRLSPRRGVDRRDVTLVRGSSAHGVLPRPVSRAPGVGVAVPRRMDPSRGRGHPRRARSSRT